VRRMDVGMRKDDCKLQTPRRRWSSRLGHLRHSKGPGKLSLPANTTPRAPGQQHQQGIQESYPQRTPTQKLGGLLIAQGSKVKPVERVRAA
jgi:hypothetical protein